MPSEPSQFINLELSETSFISISTHYYCSTNAHGCSTIPSVAPLLCYKYLLIILNCSFTCFFNQYNSNFHVSPEMQGIEYAIVLPSTYYVFGSRGISKLHINIHLFVKD